MESTQNIQEPEEIGSGQPAHAASAPLPPWDMYTVAVGLFSGYILVPLLVSNILTLTAPFLEPTYEIFIQQATTFASWVAIFFILAWRYRSNILPWLGVDFSRSPGYYLKEAIHVILVMLTMMVLVSLWIKWTGGASERPYESYTSNELRIISFFAILMAPVLEEVVFRGFVQTTFHKISTPVRSVIFTCLLFLLFHGTYYEKIQALVYVLLLGLVLGYWRERTQSIIPGVIGHLFNNALASWVLFR
ncbi:MAG TPA: type II CAAX endopeptidase family protein [Coleofasciculaceae cyanobacterium]